MGSGGKGGNRRPMKGFRPGKEPGHLRTKRAKARLGEDANWAQRKMIDAVGDQTPEEVRAMMTRWTRVLLAIGIALAVLGAFLYRWSVAAGVVVHVLTLVVAVLWFRMRKNREEFVKMAEWVGR